MTRIGLLHDREGETALHTALKVRKRACVKLIVSAIINGRIMHLPSALEPVVQCLPLVVRNHPKEFIRLI